MVRVLLVEDSKEIQDLLLSIFDSKLKIDIAETISLAMELLNKNSYQLILLDLGLPDGSGYDLCQKLINQTNPSAPAIMVLSARTAVQDKVEGFRLGIDDYIEKPFNPIELKARIEAKIKKTMQNSGAGPAKFVYGPLEFDLSVQSLTVKTQDNKNLVPVTPIEFKLLLALCRLKGQTISREELIKSIWIDSPHISRRGVDTHISHLRKKLNFLGDIIESHYGEGYRLTLPNKLT